MLDAYAIRKAIPRLIIAVIAINLSIYLCVAALDITTIIGKGLNQLLMAPFIKQGSFEGFQIESDVSNNILGALGVTGLLGGAIIAVVGSIGAVGSTILAVIGFLLPMIITIALIALAVLFTLVIRQGLLVFLIIVSPVAIACYVLPGTEKYFRQWFDLFIRTLAVYPIIAAIFAMSNVMAAILLASSGGQGNTATMVNYFNHFAQQSGPLGTVQIIAAILVLYAPLVLIPFAFKLAGGAISAVMNAASGRAANLAGRAGKSVQQARQDPNTFLGKAKLRAHDRRAERGLTSGQIMSGVTNIPGGMRRGNSLRQSYRMASQAKGTEHSQHRMDEIAKHAAVAPVANNDDLLEAARRFDTENEMIDFLENEQGYSHDSAVRGAGSVMRARAVASREEFNRFAAVQIAGTGTGYRGGVYEMNEAIIEASGGDRVLEGNMMAMARSKAGEARRYDLLPGFGTSMRAIQAQREGATEAEIEMMVTDNVLLTQGPGAIIGGRGDSVRNLVPALQRRIERAAEGARLAHASGNQQAIEMADRELKQVMASNAGLLDVAAQVSPENARILADGYTDAHGNRQAGIMNYVYTNAGGTQVMISDAVEALRSDAEFGQMRREYSTGAAQQVQAMQAGQQMAQQIGAQGGNIQPPPGAAPPGVPGNSDSRIKENITKVATTKSGIDLYKFNYLYSNSTYVGVIAQEILKTHPEAVYTDELGFYGVDYAKLGLKMQTIEEWERSGAKLVKAGEQGRDKLWQHTQ